MPTYLPATVHKVEEKKLARKMDVENVAGFGCGGMLLYALFSHKRHAYIY